MRIEYTPALRDEELEMLENELLLLADELRLGDLDVTPVADRAIPAFDIFYGDGRPEDAALRAGAERLVVEFNARRPMRRFRAITLRVA